MKQGIYRVESNVRIADGTWKMRLLGDTSAIVRAGQFVDLAVEGFFLRRPIAVLEWDTDGFSIIYKVVGKGTDVLSRAVPGDELDVLVGLGNGFDASACRESALVVCGGIGASPVFSLVKELLSRGKKVRVVLGFNKAGDVILEDEYAGMGADLQIVTMDGSKGIKGLVTVAIPDSGYDYMYCCGPKVMMKAVCEAVSVPGEISLEERMGCGCGICYGCTCHTTEGPRRICADGPVFKKEEVIW